MGGDGGAVAKRSELVKAAKERAEAAFGSECYLSGEPLEDPVMSDWRGRVYNKEAVLESLLGIKSKPPPTEDFASLRDLCQLNDRTMIDGVWCCPITRRPVARQRTCYFPECGHTVAQRALKVVEQSTCPVCEHSTRGSVLLNAQAQEDIDRAAARISALRKDGLTHSLRKRHKKTNNIGEDLKRKAHGRDDRPKRQNTTSL